MTVVLLPAIAIAALATMAALFALAGPERVRRRLARLLALNKERSALENGNRYTPAGNGRDLTGTGADLRGKREPPAGGAVTSAEDGLADTAMMLDLIGAMLDAGAGVGRSLQLVADCSSAKHALSLRPVVSALAIGADWDTAWRSSAVQTRGMVELRDALGFAALTGAPSSAILYAQAARMRRERFRAAEKRAAALGVRLVIPLGLCSLPAFICLGVVPVLLAMIPSAG
ncbi:type II secretion system F family protein [Arthrobacter sp. R1-13]